MVILISRLVQILVALMRTSRSQLVPSRAVLTKVTTILPTTAMVVATAIIVMIAIATMTMRRLTTMKPVWIPVAISRAAMCARKQSWMAMVIRVVQTPNQIM